MIWEGIGIQPEVQYDIYSGGIQRSHYEMAEEFAEHVAGQLELQPRLRNTQNGKHKIRVDQAEPASTLQLLKSTDLESWEVARTWTYSTPMEFDVAELKGESTTAVFFKVKHY